MTAKNNPFDAVPVSRRAAMRSLPPLAVVLLLAAAASAHGPPDVRPGESRLLADHNDDCGGHGPGEDLCNGSHDLVGLDVREERDDALGDVVVFRFMLNGGVAADGLGLRLTLQAGASPHSFTLNTTDNTAFTGTGFARIGSAAPLLGADGRPDGDRFTVEAAVSLQALGGAGVRLTDYTVEAFRAGAPGDFMPGGSVSADGTRTENPPQGDDVTNFNRVNGYVLRGPATSTTTPTPDPTSAAADGAKGAPAPPVATVGLALLAAAARLRRA